jgi:hypothetical protein
MSETRRARNAFFYALAAYILVCWLAAKWPNPVAPLAPAAQGALPQSYSLSSLLLELCLKAPRFADLLFPLLTVLAHVLGVITSALNPVVSAGCG